MLALSIAALALLALARPASAYPILAESDVVAFPISATCKAPFTLERFLPHTAVPRQFDHCLETLEPEGVGIYKDTGCGVGIVPNTTVPQVCARTVYNTTEGDAVWLGPCRAGDKLGTGGGDGGRWDMVLGDTLVRSMEAQTPDYCLTANKGRTGVYMSMCAGVTVADAKGHCWGDNQAWVTEIHPNHLASLQPGTASGQIGWIRFDNSTLCLAAAHTTGNDTLVLQECSTSSTAQIFQMNGLGQGTTA